MLALCAPQGIPGPSGVSVPAPTLEGDYESEVCASQCARTTLISDTASPARISHSSPRGLRSISPAPCRGDRRGRKSDRQFTHQRSHSPSSPHPKRSHQEDPRQGLFVMRQFMQFHTIARAAGCLMATVGTAPTPPTLDDAAVTTTPTPRVPPTPCVSSGAGPMLLLLDLLWLWKNPSTWRRRLIRLQLLATPLLLTSAPSARASGGPY